MKKNNPVNVIDPDGNYEKYEKKEFFYSDGYGTYSSKNSTASIGFDGVYQNIQGGGNGDDKKKKENSSEASTNKAATVLSGGWAIAIGEPTPFGEVAMGVATGAAILY